MNLQDERKQAREVAKLLGVPYADTENRVLTVQPGQGLDALVPEIFAMRHDVLPLFIDGETLAAAFADPGDEKAVQNLALITGFKIQPFIAARKDLARERARFYRGGRP
jgi:hypothetical protein